MANPVVKLQVDSLPPSEVAWHPVELGAGQEPSPFADFQFTNDQGSVIGGLNDYRRSPDSEWIIISRWPERP